MFTLEKLKTDFSVLPQTPGVYLFKNQSGTTLYIGKAKNLRNRVKSYFLDQKLGPKTRKMLELANGLDFIIVDSDLSALLLESSLINKYKPDYNIISKDDKSPLYIVITKEEFPRVKTTRGRDLKLGGPQDSIYGPFPSGSSAKLILRRLRPIFPYCETKTNTGRPCLYSHIGLCSPCPRHLSKTKDLEEKKAYLSNIRNLKKVLSGKFTQVIKILEEEMESASLSNRFEDAARARDQIRKLKWVAEPSRNTNEYLENPNLLEDEAMTAMHELKEAIDMTVLPKRIECYDISHTGRENATSSMVVATNGRIDTSQYRHFKIKHTSVPNDPAAIAETIQRRLAHKDWGTPDLIVVDGGITQLNAAMEIFNSSPHRNEYPNLYIISLAKKFEEMYIPQKSGPVRLFPGSPGSKLLIHLRDESHRFARRLHHKLRSKSLLQ
jgi:excinuclease ABC subunit C